MFIQSEQDYENFRDSQQDLPEQLPEFSDGSHDHQQFKYSHDYPGDTVLEFSRSGKNSLLQLSFTSEDPDAGTETLIFHGENAETMETLVQDLLEEITAYLDWQDTSSFESQQHIAGDIHSMEDMYDDYTRTALYAFEGILQENKQEQHHFHEWHPIESAKAALLYSTSGTSGCIGHLRGDFGSSGQEFWTSWFDQNPGLKNPVFQKELQTIVNDLRKPDSLLQNFSSMQRSSKSGTKVEDCYGFRMETARYDYCLRCIPRRGDYNFYLYCYDKAVQLEHAGKTSLRDELSQITPQSAAKKIKNKEPER